MNPLYFGSSDCPLYGVYHPPKARQGRQTGVVLCAPFGQEYMRAHRAFRQLSLLLAKEGFHVFRFDYAGTGDSAGDSNAFQLSSAISDTESAIEELRDMADVARVVLIGLRLGGTIATQTAARRPDVSGLVLWDPVLDGAAYLAELLADVPSGALPLEDGVIGVMGYPVTHTLRRELQQTVIGEGAAPKVSRALVMCHEAEPRAEALVPWLRGVMNDEGRASFRHEPIQGRWNEVDNWGSAMIPQAAIQSLVSWLAEEVR